MIGFRVFAFEFVDLVVQEAVWRGGDVVDDLLGCGFLVGVGVFLPDDAGGIEVVVDGLVLPFLLDVVEDDRLAGVLAFGTVVDSDTGGDRGDDGDDGDQASGSDLDDVLLGEAAFGFDLLLSLFLALLCQKAKERGDDGGDEDDEQRDEVEEVEREVSALIGDAVDLVDDEVRDEVDFLHQGDRIGGDGENVDELVFDEDEGQDVQDRAEEEADADKLRQISRGVVGHGALIGAEEDDAKDDGEDDIGDDDVESDRLALEEFGDFRLKELGYLLHGYIPSPVSGSFFPL